MYKQMTLNINKNQNTPPIIPPQGNKPCRLKKKNRNEIRKQRKSLFPPQRGRGAKLLFRMRAAGLGDTRPVILLELPVARVA